VKKDPGPHDCGIRFYRPKPYLLIAPFEENKENLGQDGKPTSRILTPSDRYVTIKLDYLPDFSEEYSIQINAGIGTNNTQVTLKDGWNLTQLNSTIDSKTSENIQAVAKLLESAPKTIAALTDGSQRKENQDGRGNPLVVASSNVPLGYYEAVLSPGPDGKKRLYGWRYVGFMPFQACPVEGSGLECKPCSAGDIFGLGFENGVMTFRQLNLMNNNNGSQLRSQQPPTSTSIRASVYDAMSDKGIAVEKFAVAINLNNSRYDIDIYQLSSENTRSIASVVGDVDVFKTKLSESLKARFGLENIPEIKIISPVPQQK
jgi:hypothetical protein